MIELEKFIDLSLCGESMVSFKAFVTLEGHAPIRLVVARGALNCVVSRGKFVKVGNGRSKLVKVWK